MPRFLLLLLLVFATPLHASTTPAEKAANEAAQRELDSSPKLGNIPSYSLPPAALTKAQHLDAVGTVLHFGGSIWSLVYTVLLLATGTFGAMQRVATARFRNRWLQGVAFLALFVFVTGLLDAPLGIYGHWLRLKYGLSVQRWPSWLVDQAKSAAIALVIGTLLVMLLFWFIRKFPRGWWFGFWLASIPITLAGIFLTPYVIDPLFNKFEPLTQSHPELVRRLEEVANKGNMNIPADRMFLMNASAKTTTLNAYVTGFGASKRVVVWDTSIAKGTPDQILFIFGHESGHYVLHHIVRGILVSTLLVFLSLFLGYHFVQWSIQRFGSRWGIASQSDWAALAVLLLAFSLFGFVLEPVTSAISRDAEHAADVYGIEAVHGIVVNPQETARSSFQVLGETSFDVPNPDQFLEFWTYGHPSIGRRAAFSAHYDPWAPGNTPKFFKRD